ncbi:MAG: dihydrodipicolinate synthase family protein [Clostridia bacterium]|nr:dihydrodipicolinate synthase family protein [Clostridia bacterium]
MNRHEKALEMIREGIVIPATPLALDKDRRFSPKRQKFLTGYYLEAGVGGIATAVHTTQFEIRKPEYNLFEPVITAVREAIEEYENRKGVVVARVCGVCGPTEQAVSEARIAKRIGYDAVLLSPGGLSSWTEDQLIERARAVAKEMPVIGFYLQLAVGGRFLSYDFWRRFCEIDNVVAIKCASFNRYSTIDVVRAAALSSRADQITLYIGNDDNIIADLLTPFEFCVDGKVYEKRFMGGLLGHWTVWTKRVVELFPRLRGGDATPELMTLAAQMTDCNEAVFDTAHQFAGVIAGVHEVLYRQGLLETTYCLNPSEVLSEGQAEEIDRVCRMYPHLTDDEFVRDYIERHQEELE